MANVFVQVGGSGDGSAWGNALALPSAGYAAVGDGEIVYIEEGNYVESWLVGTVQKVATFTGIADTDLMTPATAASCTITGTGSGKHLDYRTNATSVSVITFNNIGIIAGASNTQALNVQGSAASGTNRQIVLNDCLVSGGTAQTCFVFQDEGETVSQLFTASGTTFTNTGSLDALVLSNNITATLPNCTYNVVNGIGLLIKDDIGRVSSGSVTADGSSVFNVTGTGQAVSGSLNEAGGEVFIQDNTINTTAIGVRILDLFSLAHINNNAINVTVSDGSLKHAIEVGQDAQAGTGDITASLVDGNVITMLGSDGVHCILLGGGADNAVCQNNTVVGVGGTNEFGIVVKAENCLVQGNVVDAKRSCLIKGGQSNQILNNTFVSRGTYGIGLVTDTATPDNNIVINNIVDGTNADYAVNFFGDTILNNSLNFNNYITGSSGIGFDGSTAYTTMATWTAYTQTNLPDNDSHSLNVDPELSATYVPGNRQVATGGNAAYEYYMGGVVPEIAGINLVLNSQFTADEAWTKGANVTIPGTSGAIFLGNGTSDETLLKQDTPALVAGATYKVTLTASGINIADPAGFFGVQLAGGNATTFTQDGTYTFYIKAGTTLTDGLEITVVNPTTGDDLVIDDVSVVVEHFKPSTNLDSVFITRDLKVAAGAQLVSNDDFSSWDGAASPDNTPNDGWVYSGGIRDGNNEFIDAAGLEVISNGDIDLRLGQGGILTTGKEYLVTITIGAYTDGVITLSDSGVDIISAGSSGSHSATYVALSQDIELSTDNVVADCTVTSIAIYELTTGPIDEFEWLGEFHEGERVYTSVNEHQDGLGNLSKYFIWNNVEGGTLLRMSTEIGVQTTARWASVYVAGMYPIDDDYIAQGLSVGQGEATYGPTDHSTVGGSPGLETDGSSGFIDLKTSLDYLNDLRAGKFAIVSVFSPEYNGANRRFVSAETSGDVGFTIKRDGSLEDKINFNFSGTPSQFIDASSVDNGKPHTFVNVIDIASTNAWAGADGVLVEDSTVDALDAVRNTNMTLGGTGYAQTSLSIAKFAFTASLDLSGVATVNESFATGLAEAINTAALSSNYDATTIANAIFDYDNNITGIYWPLNEISSGDASSYYLLARDITDDVEFTDRYYGLVSPAGVLGTFIVSGGGRYGGQYRSRYSGQGRYAGGGRYSG